MKWGFQVIVFVVADVLIASSLVITEVILIFMLDKR